MAEFDRTIPYYQEVGGLIIPGGFSAEAFKGALAYKPRDDDFFIVTYPKSGTTWTQQIVYLIYNKGKPAKHWREFFVRNPFLDLFGRESGEQMSRPGAIKAHLPYHLIPYSDKAKYLYVVRNPKDTVVSYYHHAIASRSFVFQEGTFDRFFEDFVIGKIAYGDYFAHVLSWYGQRNDPNVMFITYEELKKDTTNIVLKIAKFMGDEWLHVLENEDGVLDDVLKFSSIEYMRSALNIEIEFKPGYLTGEQGQDLLYPGLKHVLEFSRTHSKSEDIQIEHIRKGQVGGWKEVMSADQVARLNERIEKYLKDTSIYKFWKSIDCI